MSLKEETVKLRLERIRKEYSELRREGKVDAYLLKEEIKSFLSDLKSIGGDYEEQRREAEDILMHLFFILQDTCCSPKAKSRK